MNRFRQCILIASTILGSWLGMQAVHELGHVLAARVTGRGIVGFVALHPLRISYTHFTENQDPLTLAWGGPLVGVLLPLILWSVLAALRRPFAFVARFFAGFCLIANGLYLGIGSFSRAGDAGDLLQWGAPLWQLWLFGAVTVLPGLLLWNRQGAHFGLGPNAEPISARAAYGTFTIFVALLVLGLVVDGR